MPIHRQHEFFVSTSGRWLWDEEKGLRERYRYFDVAELQKIAAGVTGSTRCISMAKIGEGNFNKVFRLVMDDGSAVMARIPNPNAGPPFYTTASEVATMDFARSILHIPVPKVLAYSADAINGVGSEYIIMEEARGIQLSKVWDQMELEDQINITEALVDIDAKFLSVYFVSSGGLYYADSRSTEMQPAELCRDLPTSLKYDVRRRSSLGPTVERLFWDKEKVFMDIDRGPWKSATGYVKAIAKCQIGWLRQYAKLRDVVNQGKISTAQISPLAHIDLLQKFLSVVPAVLPAHDTLLSPVLWYRDLHKGNIFVDDGKLSFIDWQSVCVGPALLQSRAPLLVEYTGSLLLKLPDNFKELPADEQHKLEDQVRRSILIYLYELNTKERNPTLNQVLQYPHGKTIDQLVEFAGTTWDGDILPFRECLIRLERDWKDVIGESSDCPHHFTSEEIRQHRQDGKDFNDTQDFWDALEGKVARSGWTPHEHFDDAVNYFKRLRQTGLDTLTGDERNEFELQTRWVEQHAKRPAPGL